jgi:basic membrane protein A and related proteins
MKKALFIALALVVAVVMLSACGGTTQGATGKATFGMVTDTGGIGDKSFNDAAWAGFTKAAKEVGLAGDPPMVQSAKADDYIPNLTTVSSKCDLTIGVGFMMQDAIKQVATKNPNKKFATIDTVVDLPNVRSQLFAENEGSFLVGVAAGMTTKSNVVGFVGGMEGDLIKKFEVGFIAGVKSVNPAAKVLVNYTGSFSDAALGKQAAMTQFEAKADVIFHASGGCGIGVIGAADEKGFWAIGVDSDQAAVSTKNKVLCSMIKRVDVACYNSIMDVENGKFTGGTKVFDLKVDGVGVSDNGKNLTADVTAKIDAYKAAIVSGKIKAPATQADLDAFTPVAP